MLKIDDMKKTTDSYISNRIKSIERHLSAFTKDENPERLHRLRIDIKKLSAVFSFIEEFYKENIELGTFKTLFKRAGEIREIQINLAVISNSEFPPTNFINQLINKENKLRQQFIKDIPKFISFTIAFRKETAFSFSIPDKKQIRKFYRNKRKIANKRFNSHNRKKLHSFRKLIKNMMYIYAMLPDEKQKVSGVKYELINKLQKDIGKWHDIYSAIIFLSGKRFKQKDVLINALNDKEAKAFDKLYKKYSGIKF